jgi:hypothetical protein
MHEEALAAAESIDNDYLRAQVLDMLGLDALTAGDLPGAREHHAAAATLHIELRDYKGSAYGMFGLAGVAMAQQRPMVAGRLLGASRYARQVVGAVVWPGMQPLTDRLTAAVEAALGPTASAAASSSGARLRIPDALGYGLAATAGDLASDPFSDWSAHLRQAA